MNLLYVFYSFSLLDIFMEKIWQVIVKVSEDKK